MEIQQIDVSPDKFSAVLSVVDDALKAVQSLQAISSVGASGSSLLSPNPSLAGQHVGSPSSRVDVSALVSATPAAVKAALWAGKALVAAGPPGWIALGVAAIGLASVSLFSAKKATQLRVLKASAGSLAWEVELASDWRTHAHAYFSRYINASASPGWGVWGGPGGNDWKLYPNDSRYRNIPIGYYLIVPIDRSIPAHHQRLWDTPNDGFTYPRPTRVDAVTIQPAQAWNWSAGFFSAALAGGSISDFLEFNARVAVPVRDALHRLFSENMSYLRGVWREFLTGLDQDTRWLLIPYGPNWADRAHETMGISFFQKAALLAAFSHMVAAKGAWGSEGRDSGVSEFDLSRPLPVHAVVFACWAAVLHMLIAGVPLSDILSFVASPTSSSFRVNLAVSASASASASGGVTVVPASGVHSGSSGSVESADSPGSAASASAGSRFWLVGLPASLVALFLLLGRKRYGKR